MRISNLNELDVGTKFYVINGHWHGEIVAKDGQKKLHIKEIDTIKDINCTFALDVVIQNDDNWIFR